MIEDTTLLETQKLLEAAPAENLSYEPTPGEWSLIFLTQHGMSRLDFGSHELALNAAHGIQKNAPLTTPSDVWLMRIR